MQSVTSHVNAPPSRSFGVKQCTGFLAALLISTGMFAACPAQADPNALGPASGYNVFSLGSASFQNTDIWGETAVGGNAVFTNYGLGTHLDSTYKGLVTTDIGGSGTFANVQNYYGNIAVGGTASGSPTLLNGGTMTTGSQPINFTSAQTTLKQTSANYFSMTANGTVTDAYGTLTLTGTKAANVFQVNASDLSSANSIKFNVTAGSTVIVNVGGINVTSYSLPNAGFSYNGVTLQANNDASQAPDVDGILFNFPYATTLSFNTSEGSILAPSAAVRFSNGHIDGSLIAGSLGTSSNPTTGEAHSFLFNGASATGGSLPAADPAAVPEPNAVEILGLGLLGLLGLGLKFRLLKVERPA